MIPFDCRIRWSRTLRVLGGATAMTLAACVQRVPISTAAMPGADVRIVSNRGMVVLDAPKLANPSDVGCRVTEFEGRVERLSGDSAYIRSTSWWRAEPQARDACRKVGLQAIVLMPDSTAREVSAIRTDKKRTNWLVGSILGTVVLIVTAAFLILIYAFRDFT